MAGETVLVVDDGREMQERVGGALTAAGYHVVFAVAGEEALEKVAEAAPDLMVTDVSTTCVSGLEMGNRLRERALSRRIPILAADDLIGRPFREEGLLRRVRALLGAEKKPLPLLLVEDNDDDADLLLRALRRESFAVTHRKVAPAALELFRGRALDVPFLVVSGAIGEETAATLMKAGANDSISKNNLARLGPALTRELAETEVRRRQRQAETERAQLQAQFLQAQKMEAIGVLTAVVAHDFNNLLGAIQIYTDLAQMKVGPDSVIEKELRQITGITDRAAGLIRQLRLFSRKEPLALQPLDLNAAAASLLKMLGRFIGERITVETAASPC